MTEVSRADRALRAPAFTWPRDDTMRVPYQVYTDPELYALEQQRLFRGPTWNFLCLEPEIPNSGDYKATHVGDAPVVVVRKMDGGISAVLNRCAHKGAVLCYKPRGNIQEFNCVYHNWVYNLEGKLQAVGFRRGVGGKGGVGADFDQSQHNLEPLRVTTYRGLVFGTFSNLTPSFRDYLGDELLKCVDRVFIKSVKVLGYHSQVLPNNWKLYAENNKDSYHASLLHVFHNTFGVVRANMGGGIKLSANGWHHLSYTERTPPNDDATGREKVRSLKEEYSLEDPSVMEHRLELGDRISALRTANIYEPHVYCHLIGPFRILDCNPRSARTESNFQVIRTMVDGAMSIFACGRAFDTFAIGSDALKLSERIIVLDSRQIDTLLVIPL